MNARFSEYVTSGAFSLTLTRTQTAALAMVEGGEVNYLTAAGALERKGLVEAIPEQLGDERYALHPARMERRLTPAGALVLSLLHQAGLTNAGGDALAGECDALREALAAANGKVRDAFMRVMSLRARIDELESQVESLKSRIETGKPKISVCLRDPLPGVPLDDICDPEKPVVQPEGDIR